MWSHINKNFIMHLEDLTYVLLKGYCVVIFSNLNFVASNDVKVGSNRELLISFPLLWRAREIHYIFTKYNYYI